MDLKFFAAIEDFYGKIFLVAGNGEIKAYVCRFGKLGKHFEKLRQLIIISPDNFESGVNQDLGHIVIAGTNTGQKTVKCLMAFDIIAFGFKKTCL